jgi:hypothetical protein
MFTEVIELFPQSLQEVECVLRSRCIPRAVGCNRFSLLLQPVYTYTALQMKVGVEFCVQATGRIKVTDYTVM